MRQQLRFALSPYAPQRSSLILHIKNLYSLLRFAFELFFFFFFFLASIRFRKCRIGCVSVGNLQQAGATDMNDTNRKRPPGAAKRSAAAAQTIGIGE